MSSQSPEDDPRREVLALLERLHRHKDAAYGDAWRKRGEVIAIFANMARKYDRLIVAFDEQRAATTEPLADTVADLCVYAAKYLTWIADVHPSELDGAGLPLPRAARISDANGPDALHHVFAAVLATPASGPDNSAQTWERVQSAFTALERGLMAQAAPRADPTRSLTMRPRRTSPGRWSRTASGCSFSSMPRTRRPWSSCATRLPTWMRPHARDHSVRRSAR